MEITPTDAMGAGFFDGVPGASVAPSASVEKQLDIHACGQACVVMIARRRGVAVRQADLLAARGAAERFVGGASPADLVALLEVHLPGAGWAGGRLGIAAGDLTAAIRQLTDDGPWLALLHTSPTRVGHWVVVEHVVDDVVALSDPEGVVCYLPIETFASLWSMHVGVIARFP